MDMLKDMNQALAYIEEHLDQDIDYAKVAQLAGTSEYHFRRLFSYLAGISLNTYVRNRRLSQACQELHLNNMKVVDIAIKYGYHSVDGFTRAFKDWLGIAPSEVKSVQDLKVFPRMTFQLTIRGGIDMNYRIEQKDAFKLVGIKRRVAIVFEGENSAIVELAQSITEEQRRRLQSYRNTDVTTVVNASYHFSEDRYEEKGELDHLIGSITTLDADFEGFEVVEVPACTWAIFNSVGPYPHTLQETWARIASEWLPSSSYELIEVPEICFSGNLSDPERVYSEIWIGVKEKAE
ncbi:AraC family transcriptional regulator [Paenibacillus alvei]|uniref:AraC family transcriptional regulator n=1 Tax=Paenibacillus alvei TaxID=44250 RepID=A0AAP6ZW92_PAEAL|nr:AraC family transcriptional regulator [Paenibacillus alvei]NOJ71194.1 AraC family transcriptional regulator [Paenibacillus alvei]